LRGSWRCLPPSRGVRRLPSKGVLVPAAAAAAAPAWAQKAAAVKHLGHRRPPTLLCHPLVCRPLPPLHLRLPVLPQQLACPPMPELPSFPARRGGFCQGALPQLAAVMAGLGWSAGECRLPRLLRCPVLMMLQRQPLTALRQQTTLLQLLVRLLVLQELRQNHSPHQHRTLLLRLPLLLPLCMLPCLPPQQQLGHLAAAQEQQHQRPAAASAALLQLHLMLSLVLPACAT
jgi:hypothetical protein